MGEKRRYICPSCGQPADSSANFCVNCGAPVDVRHATDASGWTELPPVRDMAKIQFGQSTCQIEGNYVPVADINLASASDAVYFTHHVLLWKEPQVEISRMQMAGGWTRLFAGLPLVMTQAHGPGRIAFSKDAPGEMLALTLQPGQTVDVREHVFLLAAGNVAYGFHSTGVWFTTGSGKDSETHYPMGPYLDQFTALREPGLLLLHGEGNVFTRVLAPGQTLLVKPTALLYKDSTVDMRLHLEHPAGTWRSFRSWGERYCWLRLRGPGRVAVQSAYHHFEDPGTSLTLTAPGTTSKQWAGY